ncbi:class D beta-lactamase [Rhizobium sp. SAFR-030]|uniref:class D beta-lactamase n=1 Tax=Rhizobium sp. SAFR-030 TaxID=3387277 RepID=UPI003F80751D
MRSILPLVLLGGLAAPGAHAAALCTLVADAESGRVLVQEGQCEERVTPASTFKIALAVMGYDAGFLKDATHPVLPFKKGYPDWGGAAWKKSVDPTSWLKNSVVWYSQQITKTIGAPKLTGYARSFGYGNADFSGDRGKNNGLERAWIASSLKISPVEQVAFLRKLVNGTLSADPKAVQAAMAIVEKTTAEDGWTIHGKTGMAYPRKADYSFDEEHPWGWFVGWGEKDGRRVVFARLEQDERKMSDSPSQRAKATMIAELPRLPAQP